MRSQVVRGQDWLISGQGTHNVVFVATENDSVYAFDADSNGGANGGLLWQTNLGASALSNNHEFGDRYNGGNYTDIVPEVGITEYAGHRPRLWNPLPGCAAREWSGASTNYYHSDSRIKLITNGSEQSFSPVIVTNSVPGTGVDSSKTAFVTFSAIQENQRPGMTLAGGMLYVSYGSFADTDPYHGWVLGFNATNLQQSARYAFNTTPNATIAAFGANAAEGARFGWSAQRDSRLTPATIFISKPQTAASAPTRMAVIIRTASSKLSTSNGLKLVADYFTPYNQLSLANGDAGFGFGRTALAAGLRGKKRAAHPHLIVGAGKEGENLPRGS